MVIPRTAQMLVLATLMLLGGCASKVPALDYAALDTTAVKVIGTNGWDYTGIGKEKALIGGWFSAADPKGWTAFTRRYVETLFPETCTQNRFRKKNRGNST